VLLLLAFMLFPSGVPASDDIPLAKIEDYELRSVLGNIQESARLVKLPGCADFSGYGVRVLSATASFQDRTICHQSWQTKIFIFASENGEEFPDENVWALPLGCGWEFSRWVSFPESEKSNGPTVLEFIRELEDDSQQIYHVWVSPHEGKMKAVAMEDADFYPPRMGYGRLDWDWKDHFAVKERLAEQTNELFSAGIARGRLQGGHDHQNCPNGAEVLILSLDQNSPARSSGQSFFLCLDDGDWAFGEWTLTGMESIEAGYLGFTLVDRKSKKVRRILCNPWTAYYKDAAE